MTQTERVTRGRAAHAAGRTDVPQGATAPAQGSASTRAAAAPPPARPPATVGALLGLWLTGQVVSLAGTRLINVAVPWFVLVTTGDARLAGVAAFAQMAPMILAKTLAGPLIDRLGAVRVAVAADLASCLAVAAIPLLHGAGLLSWPVLLVVAAVEGTLRGPGDASKYSLCPRLAEATGRPMVRITGLANTVDRLGSAVGAALGGMVIAAVGAPSALWWSCGTFAGAAALVGLGVGPRLRALGAAPVTPAPVAAAGGEPEADPAGPAVTAQAEPSYWTRLREGFEFWRTDAVLVSITLIVACTNLLDQAYLAVLVPEWAVRGGFDADTVGLIFGVYTAAAVAGSAIATAVAERLPLLLTCVVAFALTGPPRYLALAFDAPRPLLLVLVSLAGFASGFLNPVIGSVVFGRIPGDLVGRVSSLQTSLCWVLIPFGGLFGGELIDLVGGGAALAFCGAVYVVAALSPLVIPGWRRVSRPAPSSAGAA